MVPGAEPWVLRAVRTWPSLGSVGGGWGQLPVAPMPLPMGRFSRAPAGSEQASFLTLGDKAEEKEPSEQVSLLAHIRSCPGLGLRRALHRLSPDCAKNTTAGGHGALFSGQHSAACPAFSTSCGDTE